MASEQDHPEQQPTTPSSPLFVGLNLPAPNGESDELAVYAALSEGYDMITCRITSRNYRKRIQGIFHELEQSSNNSSSPHLHQSSGMFNSRDVPSPGTSTLSKPAAVTGSGSGGVETQVPAPGENDVVLHPGSHVSNSIALASPWVEIDSKNARVANLSLQVLQHELTYAAFCGIPYVMIAGPKRRTNVAQYAHAVNKLLSQSPFLQIVVHLPFNEDYAVNASGVAVPPADPLSIWEVWNTIRTICNYAPNLSVALQVPKIPPKLHVMTRWFAEPVSMLVVSSRAFVSNAKGYPVLPKPTQTMLFRFFKKNTFVILEDRNLASTTSSAASPGTEKSPDPPSSPSSKRLSAHMDPNPARFAGGEQSFLLYIRHLHKIAPPPTVAEQFATGFYDFLQAPLQPLIDNLENATYEVFEKDPVKYDLYEKAIFHAILDRPHKHLSMAVVGAGRGAIVDRALKAAANADRSVTIYAVEKNSSAYVYLLKRQREEWGDSVKVILSDMRQWTLPENAKVNILVSELLGSFADNELSPECLDGVQHVLDPADGVMIPSSYTAHLTPVMSPKLYSEAWNLATTRGGVLYGSGGLSGSGSPMDAARANRPGALPVVPALHTPYVVMLFQADLISTEIKQAWKFSHPIASTVPGNQHNIRESKETFYIPHKCLVHGIAGYFEAVLYKDIQLSTRPDTMEQKSKDMVSWFPMWFPLSQPMSLPDDSEIDISLWRMTDGRKVWYEWCAESYALVPVSNAGNASPSTSNRRASNGSTGSKDKLTYKRFRLNATEIHNGGGRCFAMTL
ncbi:hypothetical protein TRVA0_010S02608 [Trichomonascus vanleenenianus]|uniref:protein arginine N-methyltransferase n=1 Tax=Trichomonascus vanleenenianus TaxID=2268995 RepID=UPI003ECB2891